MVRRQELEDGQAEQNNKRNAVQALAASSCTKRVREASLAHHIGNSRRSKLEFAFGYDRFQHKVRSFISSFTYSFLFYCSFWKAPTDVSS